MQWRAASITWLVCSDCPLVCGWYPEDKLVLGPRGGATKWAAFEKQSITVRMVVLPFDGGRPVTKYKDMWHRPNLGWIHMVLGDDVAEKGHAGYIENTFLCLHKLFVLQEALEYLSSNDIKPDALLCSAHAQRGSEKKV